MLETSMSSSSLIQKKFSEKEQRCLHIDNLRCFNPSIALHNQSRLVVAPCLFFDFHAGKGRTVPPDTKAFLYYYTSREMPRIAGELRLRVVPSDDPASYEKGSDLRFNGQMWSRSLYMLSKHNIPLYEKLKEERLFPPTWTQLYRLFL